MTASCTRRDGDGMDGRVLVVVPTYQERANIASVLHRVLGAVPAAHVLVVDDGSPDGTADVASDVGATRGHIDVLRRDGKRGLGDAYRAGFAWGLARGYDVFVEIDADLSHDPGALPSLLRAVAEGADLVIGSRYVPGGCTPGWPRRRRWLSRAGNTYARLLLGLRVRDATSGYRAYTRRALAAIDAPASRASGYGFQIELTARVARARGRIHEVPIEFCDRAFGESKMSARIACEACWLVTWWGLRDRVLRRTRAPESLGGTPRTSASAPTPAVRDAA
jgi:dolichol-phosphate mannosyltransferase